MKTLTYMKMAAPANPTARIIFFCIVSDSPINALSVNDRPAIRMERRRPAINAGHSYTLAGSRLQQKILCIRICSC
jgi:hypothetical protein